MLLILIVLGYLMGSLNGGILISKLVYHQDLRNFGSHNAGATNATRVLGAKAGLFTVVFDVLKVVVVVALASLYSSKAAVLSGMMACVGHCYPCFAEFKGGKAVASTYGYLFATSLFVTKSWLMFIVPLAILVAIFLKTRIVSLGSLVSLFVACVLGLFQQDVQLLLSTWLLFILVAYRHRENIVRLKNHTEKPLDLSKKK